MTQTVKEESTTAPVVVLFYCDVHTKLTKDKKCCDQAEKSGWYEAKAEPEDQEQKV